MEMLGAGYWLYKAVREHVITDDLISRQDSNDTKAEEVAQPELEEFKKNLLRAITAGIIITDAKDVYSCGMRNGMRWCRSLLEDEPPKFEDASVYCEELEDQNDK